MRALPIELIDRRADCRALDDAAVAGLVDSIGAVGLINPIRARAVGDRWEVIAGSHRLAACERLGLVEIECIVVSDDDLHAELAMIDENLCRAELSPSDRATQTARRKAIYLELHPETGHGKASPNKEANFASFTDATAAVTGAAPRTVKLDAERGEKVIPEVMAMIRDTKLDTGTYLDKLKKLSPNDQVAAAKRDLAQLRRANQKPRRPKRAPLTDEEIINNQYQALVSAWDRARPEARELFRADIDTPVMDRNAA